MNSSLLFDLPPCRPTTIWRNTALPFCVGSNHTSVLPFYCPDVKVRLRHHLSCWSVSPRHCLFQISYLLIAMAFFSSGISHALFFFSFSIVCISYHRGYNGPLYLLLYIGFLVFSIMIDQKISKAMLRAMGVELVGS